MTRKQKKDTKCLGCGEQAQHFLKYDEAPYCTNCAINRLDQLVTKALSAYVGGSLEIRYEE